MNSGALRYCSGDLSVLGGANVAGTLTASSMDVTDALTVDTLTVSGPLTVDTLNVSGATAITGVTTITGATVITGATSVTGSLTLSAALTSTTGPIMSNGHLVPGSLAPPANVSLDAGAAGTGVASGAQGKFSFAAIPAPAAADVYRMAPPAGYKVDARTTLQIANAGATCQGVWATMTAAGVSPDQGYATIALQSAVAVPLPAPALYAYAWFGLQPL